MAACRFRLILLAAALARPAMAASGFGPRAKPRVQAAKQVRATGGGSPVLRDDATACLQRAGGDLGVAQSLYLSDGAKLVQSRDPEAFSRLVSYREKVNAVSDRTSYDRTSHELLLKLTWNSIAAFMPFDARPSRKIDRRLKRIADASCKSESPLGASGPILDVGCGDGELVPHIRELAPDQDQSYLGIDLSTVMVERARRAHPNTRFEECSFAALASRPPQRERYACVIFNGALQFFADQDDTLASAAALLRPGGRIVIAHVHGASFVRQENSGNRAVAVSTLPTRKELEAAATRLGMIVEEDALSAETGGEDFYLFSLIRLL
ncbi:S-adenosyl-L-methionine-dependent methyltransferase, partial [Pavlovales sp. CCMP2436]